MSKIKNEDLYLEYVMETAEKKGKFFLLDTGEGNGYIDPNSGWYIEDLSGWYIDIKDKEKLINSKEKGTAYEEFSEYYVFAEWSKTKEGKLQVTFKKY